MNARALICIVEGRGERAAVPIVVNRMLEHLGRHRQIVADPTQVLCSKDGDRITGPYDPAREIGIEYFVQRAARDNPGGILVVVDAEERCLKREAGLPALGPHLRQRAAPFAGSIRLGVVVANRMFEAWFLADFHSLRSRGHLPVVARLSEWKTPERLGGCKGWMRDLLGHPYREPLDQPRLAEHLSLPLKPAMRRRAPSYWKLFREIDKLSR
jgi:hypothetical protein